MIVGRKCQHSQLSCSFMIMTVFVNEWNKILLFQLRLMHQVLTYDPLSHLFWLFGPRDDGVTLVPVVVLPRIPDFLGHPTDVLVLFRKLGVVRSGFL